MGRKRMITGVRLPQVGHYFQPALQCSQLNGGTAHTCIVPYVLVFLPVLIVLLAT